MVDSFVNVENVRLFTNKYYETERLNVDARAGVANEAGYRLYLNLSQTLVVLLVYSGADLAALDVEAAALTVGGFVTLNICILPAFQP